jgi:CubicO group peptidase (beta-lactamase class C family)
VREPQRCEQPAGDRDEPAADPAAVEMDPDAVASAIAYASARGAQSVRVYRHGCLIGRSWLDPSTERSPMASWSMTKGVVSMVVGRAVTQGHLRVDDPIGAHLPGLSPAHARLTVRHLLTQTSGLRFAWLNDLNAAATGDSAALVLTRPFEAEPGTRFIYAQTVLTALVAVVEAAVGEDFQRYADRELFGPIGIRRAEWSWQRDGAGRTQGFAFLDMSPRAFARLGSLLLEEGRWRGRRLIDAGYVRDGAMGTEANPGYGYLWWTNRGERYRGSGYLEDEWLERRWLRSAPPDAFGLSGLFNQNVIVVPSLDLVVVRMGLPQELFGDPLGMVRARHPDWDHRFFQILLAGVRDVDVPDPGPWEPDPEFVIPLRHLVGIGF